MERKNHDYAGQTREVVDPFANFRVCEALGLCSAEVGVLVRLSDKLSRLATFATAGNLKVEDEAIQDTFLDVINYTVLLAGIVKDRESQGVRKSLKVSLESQRLAGEAAERQASKTKADMEAWTDRVLKDVEGADD